MSETLDLQIGETGVFKGKTYLCKEGACHNCSFDGKCKGVSCLGDRCYILVEESLIDTRQKTHGDYKSKCEFIQPTKEKMRQAPNWETLPNHQKESLDFFMTKIGRILYGDPSEKDHWADISGYAELGKEVEK